MSSVNNEFGISDASVNALIPMCFNSTRQRGIIKYKDIDMIDALYLSVFVHCSRERDMNTVFELKRGRKSLPLSADSMFIRLVDKGLISIDPETSLDQISFKNGKIIDFNLYEMSWKVHIEEGVPRKGFEKKIISNKQKVMHTDDWYGNEVKAIWQQIATDECLDYFLVKTAKLALSVNQNHLVQIRKLLSDIVVKYSLSRCFEMIYSVCNASQDYIRNGNYTDEIRKQDILFADFQNGAKNISKYTVGPCIEERLNETRRSVALRVLFEEILNFDYAEDWFDACLVDMDFFE